MPFLGLLLLTFAKILKLLIEVYSFVVLIAVFLTWIRPDPYNPIVRFIYQVTSPLFRWVRRFIPQALFRTGFDWTPIFVFILLIALDTFVVGSLFDLAIRLRGGLPVY